ncbi:MAG: hypothetical protein OXO49_09330 [Gammaproteobacteria bacterium]|nr:hypothetical protein [Gammaproteobacteria bacterium]MDE0252784.1 hypothetical protein [Gammaproteobacteria bacterium]MDE0402208.1 hypothetical protein [Gammaproteobacteria bacterium]
MTDFFNDNPEQTTVDPAYTGSRAQAIADGEIVDVSEIGSQVGFKWPVAITKTAWDNLVTWSDEDSERQVPQREKSRLYELMSKCADSVRMRGPKCDRMKFHVQRVPRDGIATKVRTAVAQIVAHPGDAGEPVLTIRMPAK